MMQFRCVCDPEVNTQVTAPSCGALVVLQMEVLVWYDTSPVTDCHDQIINEYMCWFVGWQLII